MTRLEEIEERCNKATDGSWRVSRSFWVGKLVFDHSYNCIADCKWNEDTEFIAHSKDDVAYLIARVRKLEAHAAKLTMNASLAVEDVLANIRPTDVICHIHGHQFSGDNTCEPCYLERAKKNGPGLNAKLKEILEPDDA